MIEGIGDHDDHRIRRVRSDLLGDLLDDLGVDLQQVHARHAGLARQTGGDDDDIAAGGVGVVVGAGDHRPIPLEGPRLVHVERQALGEPFDDVGHHDFVGEIHLSEPLDRRGSVLARANDGDLRHASSPCGAVPSG